MLASDWLDSKFLEFEIIPKRDYSVFWNLFCFCDIVYFPLQAVCFDFVRLLLYDVKIQCYKILTDYLSFQSAICHVFRLIRVILFRPISAQDNNKNFKIISTNQKLLKIKSSKLELGKYSNVKEEIKESFQILILIDPLKSLNSGIISLQISITSLFRSQNCPDLD